MTAKSNGWWGQPPGTLVDATNSATSGNALNTVTQGAGASVAYSNAVATYGGTPILITPATGVSSLVNWTGFSSATMACYAFLYFATIPAVATTIMQFRTGVGQACNVTVNAAGKLAAQDRAGATKWTAAAALQPSTLYGVHMEAASATSSAGTLRAGYWLAGQVGDVDNSDTVANPITGVDTLGGNLTTFQVGKLTTSTFTGLMYIGDMACTDGTLTTPALPGPWAIEEAPFSFGSLVRASNY